MGDAPASALWNNFCANCGVRDPPPLGKEEGGYPPPLQTTVTTVGKDEIYHWEVLSGHFWYITVAIQRPPGNNSSHPLGSNSKGPYTKFFLHF